jgi:nucleoside 2-deoxyribosyltransferase
MKMFIAYRHTGEKTKDLEDLLGNVRAALSEAGVNVYCAFFEEAEFQSRSLAAHQIMDHAFSLIDGSDMLFVIQTSKNKSEGMLMEVGYCIAKKIPIVVAVKSDVKQTYLPDMANTSFRWKDPEDLKRQIAATNFSSLTTPS